MAAVVLFLCCLVAKMAQRLRTILSWLALTFLILSAAVALVLSETRLFSIATALPFVATVVAAFLVRQKTVTQQL
jgi:hypothetical protein